MLTYRFAYKASIDMHVWLDGWKKLNTCSVLSWSNKLDTFPGTAFEIRSSRKRCFWTVFHPKNQPSTHLCSWSVTKDSGTESSLEDTLRDVQDSASRRWGPMTPEAGGKSAMETWGWVDQPCPSDIPNCVMVCLETCVWDRSSTVGAIMDASGWPEPCKAWWNQAISNKVRKRRVSVG